MSPTCPTAGNRCDNVEIRCEVASGRCGFPHLKLEKASHLRSLLPYTIVWWAVACGKVGKNSQCPLSKAITTTVFGILLPLRSKGGERQLTDHPLDQVSGKLRVIKVLKSQPAQLCWDHLQKRGFMQQRKKELLLSLYNNTDWVLSFGWVTWSHSKEELQQQQQKVQAVFTKYVLLHKENLQYFLNRLQDNPFSQNSN